MRDLGRATRRASTRRRSTSRYSIIEQPVKDTSFFTLAHDGDRLVLVLNPDHPFYREIYKPLSEGEARAIRSCERSSNCSCSRRREARRPRAETTLARHRLSGATPWPRS